MIESILRTSALHVAYVAEALAVLAVTFGLARVVWLYISTRFSSKGSLSHILIRLELAQSLVLGLEFLLAADILRTAIAPSWDAIGRLAAIVLIRTVLNFFLQREMEHEAKELRDKGDGIPT
ncbi:DUF1622 domain-containing protein [soil metagenome]